MTSKRCSLAFIFVILILLGHMPQLGDAQFGSAQVCKWLKGKTGWGCDDPASRAVWRTINGVSSCDDFCRKKAGKRGGNCVSNGNYDTSTWCARGQTCRCY